MCFNGPQSKANAEAQSKTNELLNEQRAVQAIMDATTSKALKHLATVSPGTFQQGATKGYLDALAGSPAPTFTGTDVGGQAFADRQSADKGYYGNILNTLASNMGNVEGLQKERQAFQGDVSGLANKLGLLAHEAKLITSASQPGIAWAAQPSPGGQAAAQAGDAAAAGLLAYFL